MQDKKKAPKLKAGLKIETPKTRDRQHG